MRFRNGLALFEKTNSQGCVNLASFHSPHSLTWSWILSFSLPRAGSGRWLGFHPWQTNQGRQWVFQIAWCTFQWHQQSPMWYRDMYMRLRDETEIAAGRMWPGPAYQVPPPLPTVTPSNMSVH